MEKTTIGCSVYSCKFCKGGNHTEKWFCTKSYVKVAPFNNEDGLPVCVSYKNEDEDLEAYDPHTGE
jgi:hypothetical protein